MTWVYAFANFVAIMIIVRLAGSVIMVAVRKIQGWRQS